MHRENVWTTGGFSTFTEGSREKPCSFHEHSTLRRSIQVVAMKRVGQVDPEIIHSSTISTTTRFLFI